MSIFVQYHFCISICLSFVTNFGKLQAIYPLKIMCHFMCNDRQYAGNGIIPAILCQQILIISHCDPNIRSLRIVRRFKERSHGSIAIHGAKQDSIFQIDANGQRKRKALFHPLNEYPTGIFQICIDALIGTDVNVIP